MYEREKVFFAAGDLVQVKHDLVPKPLMVVQQVDKAIIKKEGVSQLLGITCMWFSGDLKVQTHRFNTKDLEKI